MQKPSSVSLSPTTPGRCRYCRCTDARACPEGCAWLDLEQTVCDSPPCSLEFAQAILRSAVKFYAATIDELRHLGEIDLTQTR